MSVESPSDAHRNRPRDRRGTARPPGGPHRAALATVRLLLALALPLVWGTACDGDHDGDDDATADDDDADDDATADDDDADDDDADDDDAGDDDTGSDCPYGEEPPPVSDSPLPPESPAGAVESTTTDGFFDEYVYDSSGATKLGIRRDWGGSVVFFGLSDGQPGTNSTNTIDGNDTGREVQVALYDPDRHLQGCAWNASCQTNPSPCPEAMQYFGWNPVQGGNRCNIGSWVDSWSAGDGELYVTTVPRQWNPNWEFQDCDSSGCDDPTLNTLESDVRLHQTIRFVRPLVAELRYTVENLDAVDHAAQAQEMPTVYTANGQGGPDLWRLFDAGGTEIPIDTLAGGEDAFYYEVFESPAPWVTLQNDDASYGVGILYENGESSFQAWQLRTLPFNNVRALFSFGIPANGTVHARAYLLLGSLATVTSEAQWLLDHLAPFGVMDEPAVGAQVPQGAMTVRGWALDNRGVASVEARVDESWSVPLSYGSSRPDVCLAWPGYPGCDDVGYSGTVDLGAPDECPHLLEIVATDTDGNQRVIANTLVTVVP